MTKNSKLGENKKLHETTSSCLAGSMSKGGASSSGYPLHTETEAIVSATIGIFTTSIQNCRQQILLLFVI